MFQKCLYFNLLLKLQSLVSHYTRCSQMVKRYYFSRESAWGGNLSSIMISGSCSWGFPGTTSSCWTALLRGNTGQQSSFFLEILFYDSYIMYTLNMFVCEILVDICLAWSVDCGFRTKLLDSIRLWTLTLKKERCSISAALWPPADSCHARERE